MLPATPTVYYKTVRGRKIAYTLQSKKEGLLIELPEDCHVPLYLTPTPDGYFYFYFSRYRCKLHRLILCDHLGIDLKFKGDTRHLCHNTYCVNPLHLAQGSRRDNVKDNRNIEDDNPTKPSVTDEQAVEIFLSTEPYEYLAEKYEITYKTVENIKYRHTYAEATEGLTRGESALKRVRMLTDDQAREVYLSTKTYPELAEIYNVPDNVIESIKARKVYKDVTEGLEKGSSGALDRHLTDDQVREIFARTESYDELAKLYNTTNRVISRIKTGDKYRHLTKGLTKGLSSKGLQKLTFDEIREIFITKGSYNSLAKQYNTNRPTVKNIKTRKYYIEVTEGLILNSKENNVSPYNLPDTLKSKLNSLEF